MANNNENFKVRHGLKVGDTITATASSGDIATSGDVAVNGGDLTTTNTTATVFNSNATTVNIAGAATSMSIGNAAGTITMPGNLTVSGDLTVSGTTTTLDTANLLVEDNTILLNKNEIGAGVTAGSAGIEIERGSLTNVTWEWNETNKWWNPTGGNGTTDQTVFGYDIVAANAIYSNGNSLVFNNDNVSSADMTITVKRDPGGDPVIKWNDSTTRWQTSVDGSTYIDIPNQDLDTDGTPTFAQLSVDNVRLDGNSIITTDTNGDLTLDPNGTGDINLTTAAGGNAVMATNLVRGTVRDSTTLANGDIWSFTSGTGTGMRGVSIDNADNTAKAPITLARSFSGGAVSGNAARGRVLFEKARGTGSSPTAVQAADFLGGVEATGYATDRWATDASGNMPATMLFAATENWVNSGTTVSNCGMQWQVNLQPQATNLAANSAVPVFALRPEGANVRANALVLARGTSATWSSGNCSISGTTLTIGTTPSGTIAVGQMVSGTGVSPGTYITANISGSGAGSTWTVNISQTVAATGMTGFTTYITATAGTGNIELSQSPVLRTNLIKASDGNTNITTTSNTLTTFAGDIKVDGNDIQASDGNTNITLTSNTLTTFAGDIKVGGNDIQSSDGTATLLMSGAAATTALRGDTLTLENAAGTDYFYANSSLTNVISPAGHINLAGEFTHINTASTNSAGMLVYPSPDVAASGKFTETSLRTHTNSANDFSSSNFTTYRTTDGVNYTPTQNGDYIGQFKFNGNANTSTTPGVPGGPTATILVQATENWSNTGTGSKIIFEAIKNGTTSGTQVINANPSNMIFRSDAYTLQDSAGAAVTSAAINYTRTYGEFCYTAGTITPAGADTIYAIPLDTTNDSSNTSISNTSRINISTAGRYKIIMSLQVKNADNTNDHILRFWLRKNGTTDVANSATLITPLKLQEQVVAMDWLVNSDGDDYWEIVYYVNSTNVTFPYYAAITSPVTAPAAPPIIVNIVPIGA